MPMLLIDSLEHGFNELTEETVHPCLKYVLRCAAATRCCRRCCFPRLWLSILYHAYTRAPLTACYTCQVPELLLGPYARDDLACHHH